MHLQLDDVLKDESDQESELMRNPPACGAERKALI